MAETSWGRRLLNGAGAGALGGVAAVAVLVTTVEPLINRSIGIEEARESATTGHVHEHSHEAAGEIVSRLQQQIGGAITVVIVGALLGLAFAVAFARSRHRLPGHSEVGRSLMLGLLGFASFALVPALLMPANPPAVGDPDTVGRRTIDYLLVIVLTVAVIAAVFAIDRLLGERGKGADVRWTAGIAVVAAGLIALALLPRTGTEIPSDVPADLIWQFRVASLAQLGAMWAVLSLTHGVLTVRRSAPARSASVRPAQVPA
ncbi:MAG: CbtA family protein [Nocardioides sp.]|uniref:CbtA family protein n=1 Tax=Nocardioides sp. TaxID=35761 RepID=UPI0039E6B4B0